MNFEDNKNKKRSNRINNYVIILSLLSIIVILLGVKVGHDDYTPNPKIEKSQEDIVRIQYSLELFKKDNLYYPTTEEGLEALVRNPDPEKYPNLKPYIQGLPLDPWGKHYQYLSPGTHGDYDFYSFGPDGVQSNDDIGSWELGTIKEEIAE